MSSLTTPTPSCTPSPTPSSGDIEYRVEDVLAVIRTFSVIFLWGLTMVFCLSGLAAASAAAFFTIKYICEGIEHLWILGQQKFEDYKERRRRRHKATFYGATEGSALLSGSSANTHANGGLDNHRTSEMV